MSDWQCGVEGRISSLETSEEEQDRRLSTHDTDIEHIKNRLPIWATTVLALLTGLVGWLLQYA